MAEIVEDAIAPRMIIVPQKSTEAINAISGAACISGAIFYNQTLNKLEVMCDGHVETITSVARA